MNGLNEGLDSGRIHMRLDPVTEVKHVTGPCAVPLENGLDLTTNAFG